MSDPQPEVHPLIRSHTLSTYQLELLLRAFNALQAEGCMQKALYDALLDRNVKLDFGMKTMDTPAGYDPRTKTIIFKDQLEINSTNLKEELFHAWQDVYYPGGITQYLNVGKVNIEFEAKVFNDIIEERDSTCCWAFSEADNFPTNLSFEYINWIYDIRDIKISLQDIDYLKWLNYFNQYSTTYSSPFHSNLGSPFAINDLINLSDCY